MTITIFSLADYASYLNGDESASGRFQHFYDLSEEQLNLLVELVESSEDYDWR